MGLLDEVRRTSGTAPIAAPTAPPPERDGQAAPAAGGDKASLSGSRQLAYGAPAQEQEKSGGFWSSLMDTAKSYWGRITGFFGGGSQAAPPPAPKPVAAPVGGSATSEKAPTGAPDPTAPMTEAQAYELETEAKIREAKEQGVAESRKWDDPRYEQAQIRRSRMEGEARARNAEVPLTDAEQAVANTFESDEQREALKRLSAEEREDFVKTYRAIGGTWGEQNEYARKASAAMRKLLTEGTLLDRDSKGGTLLRTLASHADRPLAQALAGAGLDQSGQLQNIINTLAYPDRVWQGQNTNTCVAASLQTVLAENDPSEFARIATGLIYEGEVELQNGETMKLFTGELWKEDGGRSTTSQLIQGSFREFARQYPAVPYGEAGEGEESGGGRYGGSGGRGGGRYGTSGTRGGGRYGGGGTRGAGRYGTGGTRGGGTLEAGSEGSTASGAGEVGARSVPGGVTDYQAQRMFEAVAGTMAVAVPVGDGNRDAAWRGIERSLQSGFPIPAGVPGIGPDGEVIKHQVTIMRIEGDKAWVADSGSGQAIEVSIEQLKKDLEAVVLPAQFADQTGWNIAPNPENPGDADRGGGRYGGSGGRGGGRYGTRGGGG
ncbi:MAG: hypothetical protein FJZ01_22180 [Candidatus Sericytochromatia bacterium]|nr:hypothetical protein [Candidatus Tanganyikabacteria bacterium]